MNIQEIMFMLICSEVFQQPITVDIKKHITPKAYADIYSLSQKHDISNILASAFSKIGILSDDDTSKLFRKQLMISIYRYEKINYDFNLICNTLNQAKIPYLPLKGSVIRKFYPEAWMRTSCDIDILIHKDNSKNAIKALCDIGFVHENDFTLHDYSLISLNGTHLELHYSLDTDCKLVDVDKFLNSVWQYTVNETGDFLFSMTNEMLVFYHIAHMAKHFINGGCGIRAFVDFWLLKNKITYDLNTLTTILKKTKLLQFYKSVFSLCCVWFNGNKHDEMTQKMEEYVLTGGIYGSYKNSAIVNAARGEGKIESFLKLVFIPRKNLEIIYPKLKTHPVLLPLYHVKRWLKILDKNKRDKIHKITLSRNSVSQDNIVLTNAFLKDIGLF